MKGNLENFKVEVYNTIKTACKPYKDDFQSAIGYLPYEKAGKKVARPHEYDKIAELEQSR